jgi:Protein of unknown function (DUF2905)
MFDLGKGLILFGALAIAAGVLLLMIGRIPWIGRLPGDIVFRRDDFVFVFPLTSCLLVSALFSLVLYLFRR